MNQLALPPTSQQTENPIPNSTPSSESACCCKDTQVALKRIESKLDKLSRTLKKIDRKLLNIQDNTIPALGWLPSISIAFILVYPVQDLIMETAPDYRVSAWLSGWIKDAKTATASWGMRWGIEITGGSTAFASPLNQTLVVTSSFSAKRPHPISGKIKPHNGIDYRCNVGDKVYAMQSGVVTYAAMKGNAGNMITIKHADGKISVYMHLDYLSVRKGQGVSTGQKIGACGETGRVTGPHLHVEIRTATNTPINPVKLVGITNPSGMWEYFKDTVAQSESEGTGNYQAIAKSGKYYGRYQMGRSALKDAGYADLSFDAFLKNGQLQEQVYKAWQKNNLQSARHGIPYLGLKGFVTDTTPAYRVAGLLHAAQFGIGNALRWYTEGVDFLDGNEMPISEYARRGEEAFKAKYGMFAPAAPLLEAIEG